MLHFANGNETRTRKYGNAAIDRNTVDELAFVRLGAVLQAVHICGQDAQSPLLLFLHGGPGMPHMPLAHANSELRQCFLVVQWDQRGAGKSYSPSLNEADLCIEQLVSDTHELILWLRARFCKSTVLLVGHSWGSALGAIVASRFPQFVSAFVGIGQVSNLRASEHLRFHQAMEMARKLGNRAATVALTRLGSPPYSCTGQSDSLERWAQQLHGSNYASITSATLRRLALSSPVYSWMDLAHVPLGRRFSEHCLWHEIFQQMDLFAQVPRLDVPVYFFIGRHDSIITHDQARGYFDALDAPHGKKFITFERSGHWPHLEESELFRAILSGPVRLRLTPESLARVEKSQIATAQRYYFVSAAA